ncbi:MAG: 4Fe-4S dicluster domain-containing protein [Chloroflexota bacterium]
MTTAQEGAVFPVEGGVEEGILDCIRQALGRGCFDAVLVPVKVPAGDSFAYVLVQDEGLLDDAHPLSPIMPVQGARALSSITRLGKRRTTIGAIVRPCEVRATIELAKLGQVELEDVTLISIDCPGVLPLADWFKDQRKSEDTFKGLLERWEGEAARPVCRTCDRFSATGGEDLHIGTLGTNGSAILLIPGSPKGEAFLEQLGVSPEEDISGWTKRVSELTEQRKERRKQAQKELETRVVGLDNLLDAFSNCINCHNCMRACPICYCRQCFFDSDKLNFTFEDYLTRAEKQGGLRFPPDTLLFHIGRMVHMSLSCVSCGACEDACPMAIPVSQIFSLVGDRNQAAFDYHPGRSREEPLPLRFYQEEEFEEVEDSYAGIAAGEGAGDA